MIDILLNIAGVLFVAFLGASIAVFFMLYRMGGKDE